ncbi:HNH endonuclease motif protein [Escherichia phage vB-EcoS-XT34]|nr:HNH endonuclease motif protein [Escherichia phage vB-EcoS-XT34]
MINWHDYFKYDNGVLINIKSRNGAKYMQQAGRKNKSSGYIEVMVNYKRYQAHRTVWEMNHGKIPEGMEIDHINGIRDDNRIDNLRLVTSRTNDTNRAKSKANTSGVVGVCWDKRKGLWLVRIYDNKKPVFVGYFREWFDAVCARKSSERTYNYHENHGRAK